MCAHLCPNVSSFTDSAEHTMHALISEDMPSTWITCSTLDWQIIHIQSPTTPFNHDSELLCTLTSLCDCGGKSAPRPTPQPPAHPKCCVSTMNIYGDPIRNNANIPICHYHCPTYHLRKPSPNKLCATRNAASLLRLLQVNYYSPGHILCVPALRYHYLLVIGPGIPSINSH